MQRRTASDNAGDGFADRMGDLEKEFEKLDAQIARKATSADVQPATGESQLTRRELLTYIWLPGGGILLPRMW